MNIRKIKVPGAFVLIFSIMVLSAILTWIIPGGKYTRTVNSQGREVVVDGTFQYVEGKPQGVFALLQSPIKGIEKTAHIIGFILIIGGVFAIIEKTKVITASILRLAERLKDKDKLIIPGGMLLFSIFGAVFGMSEEVIPFVLIFIPLSMALGYDSIVGVSIPFLGAGFGFAGAMLNPFTIGIAQGIAELPIFSGMVYRIIVWFIVTAVGTWLVMRYAVKVKKDPKISPVFNLDQKRREALQAEANDHLEFSTRHKVILFIFLVVIVVMVLGVMKYQWFITEIAALFLGLGILSGVIAKLSVDEIADSFIAGAKDLVGAALVVGFARAILVLATDGQIIDTIMFSMSKVISKLHPIFAAQSMFVIQSVLNFFVPSGSGKAALTMPIMSPLADLIGITRQTAVLAYQLGDGITNMIVPTSGVTMGVLGMAKIPYPIWAKWLLSTVLILSVVGLLLMIPPVVINWGPF